MRCFAVPAFLFSSALALAGQAAQACDATIVLQYDVSFGRYQIELNDVYIDSGAAQGASGGIPLNDWLLKGENRINVSIDADKGEFSVYSICDGGENWQDFDAASLTGKTRADLTFAVDDPPPHVYLDAAPTSDEGLEQAVEALKAAMAAKDLDTVWDMHAAMRADMEMNGRPMKAEAYQMGKIVENIAPNFAPNLRGRAVLGGRVWEVYGDDFAPPISANVAVNGGQVDFRTGSFWMKIDGEWSVYRK